MLPLDDGTKTPAGQTETHFCLAPWVNTRSRLRGMFQTRCARHRHGASTRPGSGVCAAEERDRARKVGGEVTFGRWPSNLEEGRIPKPTARGKGLHRQTGTGLLPRNCALAGMTVAGPGVGQVLVLRLNLWAAALALLRLRPGPTPPGLPPPSAPLHLRAETRELSKFLWRAVSVMRARTDVPFPARLSSPVVSACRRLSESSSSGVKK